MFKCLPHPKHKHWAAAAYDRSVTLQLTSQEGSQPSIHHSHVERHCPPAKYPASGDARSLAREHSSTRWQDCLVGRPSQAGYQVPDVTTTRFPATTHDAVIQARPRGAEYDMQEVQAIVLALERRDSATCKRLDSRSLIILCSIFIYSQECLAQRRGLCLLAVRLSAIYNSTVTHKVQEALHRNEPDSAQELAQKQGKKMAVGRAALTLLIKGFLNTNASDGLRRWVYISSLGLTLANILASLGYLPWNFSKTAPKIQKSCSRIHLKRNTGELRSERVLLTVSLTNCF